MVTSYISMLESSPKSPNLEILFVLAEALGAKPSEPIFAMESSLAEAPSKACRIKM
ncbi:MAG: helix-turn-helix transcriptional regulator [Bilophila sp.]|nr:helix-turn-helix transcriptional regulator [Bilophila sp.]